MKLVGKLWLRPVNYEKVVDLDLLREADELLAEMQAALKSGGKIVLQGTEISIIPEKGDGSNWKIHDVFRFGKSIDDTPVSVGRTYAKI